VKQLNVAARKSSIAFNEMPKDADGWWNVGVQSAHGKGIVPEEPDMENVIGTLNDLTNQAEHGVDGDVADEFSQTVAETDYHIGHGGGGMFSYSSRRGRSAEEAIEDWARRKTDDWEDENNFKKADTEGLIMEARGNWQAGWEVAVLDLAVRKGWRGGGGTKVRLPGPRMPAPRIMPALQPRLMMPQPLLRPRLPGAMGMLQGTEQRPPLRRRLVTV